MAVNLVGAFFLIRISKKIKRNLHLHSKDSSTLSPVYLRPIKAFLFSVIIQPVEIWIILIVHKILHRPEIFLTSCC